ncbi:MAG: response regulator [Methylomarinum sp.]|nr:response regulator [Methylomarinum sp.]
MKCDRFFKLGSTGLLEREGVAVTVANNGHEAIDLISKSSFSLILMDMQMHQQMTSRPVLIRV